MERTRGEACPSMWRGRVVVVEVEVEEEEEEEREARRLAKARASSSLDVRWVDELSLYAIRDVLCIT